MAKFNHTAHKELWDWLVRNLDKEKYDWPGWKCNGGKYNAVKCDCFACDAAAKEISKEEYIKNKCRYCPLIWDDGCSCNDAYSIYDEWNKLVEYEDIDYDRRAELARRIRDLPVKKGVECE